MTTENGPVEPGRGAVTHVLVSKAQARSEGTWATLKVFRLRQERTLQATEPAEALLIQRILEILRPARKLEGYACPPVNDPSYVMLVYKGAKGEGYVLQGPLLKLPTGKQAAVDSTALRETLDAALRDVPVHEDEIRTTCTVTGDIVR